MRSPKRHVHKKDLGQNFLIDQRVQQRIVQSCCLQPTEKVLEIGPGQGAITRLIAPHVKELVCIEKDKDLILALKNEFEGSNVTILQGDILTMDVSDLDGEVKVIGNIPYNISTPIIEGLIENRSRIAQAYLTVQLEFGQRLAAKPGGKDYGALSCFAQYNADVTILFNIKNSAFKPAPKVDSCFVLMDFKAPKRFHPKDEKLMFRFIRTVFTQRRKNILNAAASMVEKSVMLSILKALNISPDTRPEALSLQNFVDISHRLV